MCKIVCKGQLLLHFKDNSVTQFYWDVTASYLQTFGPQFVDTFVVLFTTWDILCLSDWLSMRLTQTVFPTQLLTSAALVCSVNFTSIQQLRFWHFVSTVGEHVGFMTAKKQNVRGLPITLKTSRSILTAIWLAAGTGNMTIYTDNRDLSKIYHWPFLLNSYPFNIF